MKKMYSAVVVLFMLLLFPLPVFAVDFTIEKMDIEVDIQASGDVQVTEEQTYKFDGEFNGITRTLIPKEGTQIVELEAYEKEDGLRVEQEDNLFKIYRAGNTEQITIDVTYTIKDALTVYSDVTEFYWPFFDSGNESDYSQFKVRIHPPEQTGDVIAFGYDAALDSATIEPNGDVQFDLGFVSSGKNGDIRVAYDNALFPGLAITEDKFMREDLKAEQQRLIDKQIVFEQTQRNLEASVPYVIGALTIILFIFILLAVRHKKRVLREVLVKYPAPYFVPEEEMSLLATIFFMKKNHVQPEVLSAAVMDLVRKGYAKETEDESFEVINRSPTYAHESFLIDWLFDKIGSESVFNVSDLNSYLEDEDNQETYQEDYLAWQEAVKVEQGEYDLYSKNPEVRLITGIIGALIIPFIIYLGIYELYAPMFISLILSGAFFIYTVLFKTLTVTGRRIKRDWKNLESKYQLMAHDKWEEMDTDDQKRAFIYGIGVKDKKIEQANEMLLNRYPSETFAPTNPMYTLVFLSTMNSSFIQADQTSAASVSGAAGVGAGVGGGGGGSGAF